MNENIHRPYNAKKFASNWDSVNWGGKTYAVKQKPVHKPQIVSAEQRMVSPTEIARRVELINRCFRPKRSK